MSRFKKLSHTIWYCHYHVVWTPKYRNKILTGPIKEEVSSCIRASSEQKKCEVVELNVECADGSCSFNSGDTAENIGVGVCRNSEGQDSNPSASAFQGAKA